MSGKIAARTVAIGGAHRLSLCRVRPLLYRSHGHSVLGSLFSTIHHQLGRALVSPFRLSYADVVEWLAECHIRVDASTVFDWVQKFAPLYQDAAKAHRYHVGTRWSVDETYVKMAGRWGYVYRAVDEHGQIVEVLFRERRDTEAAIAFFCSALENTGVSPQTVTTDKAAAYPPALAAVLPEIEHITGKAVQQRIERDHQHLKGRLKVFRGCKTTGGAQRFCPAHGFVRNLRQGFYRLGAISRDPKDALRPQLVRAWEELTTQLLAS